MKQRLFSLGSDFVIRDNDEREAYFVDGQAFTIGAKLSFQDMHGNELAFIRQRVLAWGPTYEIFRNGTLAAVVKKELFTFFSCTFTVDVPGPDDLVAEGDFLHHEYVFLRGSRQVAGVSKQWFSWSDSYGVDIDADQDPVLILASTVVIDMACHPTGRR
jgi:uncharacterized protein YxjI